MYNYMREKGGNWANTLNWCCSFELLIPIFGNFSSAPLVVKQKLDVEELQNICILLYISSKLRGNCSFAGQYNTEDYGTFTGVIYSFGGSTSCSSHKYLCWSQPYSIILMFMLAPFLLWSDKHKITQHFSQAFYPTSEYGKTKNHNALLVCSKSWHTAAKGWIVFLLYMVWSWFEVVWMKKRERGVCFCVCFNCFDRLYGLFWVVR